MSLFRPEYAISVGAAVALALLFPVAKHLRGGERRSYYTLQTITLLGAVLGAKLSVAAGGLRLAVRPRCATGMRSCSPAVRSQAR